MVLLITMMISLPFSDQSAFESNSIKNNNNDERSHMLCFCPLLVRGSTTTPAGLVRHALLHICFSRKFQPIFRSHTASLIANSRRRSLENAKILFPILTYFLPLRWFRVCDHLCKYAVFGEFVLPTRTRAEISAQ